MCKISAISDVHVKKPGDPADQLLSSFFNHPDVITSDVVVFLGDIFDLMCGPHVQYIKIFSHHFEKLRQLTEMNKKVYFIEGNHDVHLEKLFRKVWKNDRVILSQAPIIETIQGKQYYFSHGDEYDVDNKYYHQYMSFIRSFPLKIVADYLMPYKLLHFAGEKASRMSRSKGAKIFNAEKIKQNFRKGVIEKTRGKYDFIVGGHSHVQDYFLIPNHNSIYLNNGYALSSKTFILINNHVPSFIPLGH